MPTLGLLPSLVCPHADEPGRMEGLAEVLRETGKGCICLPNGGALCVEDETYRVLRCDPAAKVMQMGADGQLREIPEMGELGGIL